MGDLGSAAASGASGGSDLNSLFSDASLGDAMTGGTGDIFGGSSSADLSSLFADAGLGSALLGDSSGLGGVFSTATDPSGAAAASLSTTPPADAAGTPAGSDPSANIGGTQSGGVPQPGQPQQPTPPAAQSNQSQSPLAQIAKAVKATFGLGEQPKAGGPTGPTPQPKLEPPTIEGELAPDPAGLLTAALRGRGFLGGIPGAIYNTMRATPAETGELPPGGYSAPAGTGGIGSDAVAGGTAGQTAPPAQAPEPMDPTIAAGGPGAGAGQPPAAAAKPDPAAPAAPAASDPPAPAAATLPTRKGPATPEAAPEPTVGQGGPTDMMAGIGGILRDVLGLALANPTLLPMLAQAFMGGRGRGGIPPWAMHGMLPFMRGRGRGFGGFRGGFLRPGYYPRRQGGWGFHPGGWHPGWGAWAPGQMGNQMMAFAGGGGSGGGGGASGGWEGANIQSGGIPNSDAGDAGSTDANGVAHSSNPFVSRLLGLESGGQNVVSRTDKDDSGRTLAQGGDPTQISQGYFQIRPSTWRIYAARAGVDPNILPRQASYADQWKVASVIPFAQWGDRTRVALGLGNIDPRTTLGQVASRYGGTRIAGGDSQPAKPAPKPQPAVQSDDFAVTG